MSDPNDENIDKEIEDALGEESVLDIAKRELFGDDTRAAPEDGALEGSFHEGTVAGVTKDDVFVEFGPRQQGVVPFEQFATEPATGDTVRVFVEHFDPKEGLYVCSVHRGVVSADWRSLEMGSVLRGTVRATNQGGLELQCGTLTAFLPVSHIELERVEDMEPYMGQVMEVEVIDLDPDRRKLVVSRRGILGRERDAARERAAGQLVPGTRIKGKVMRVEPFGAFVDVGGVEGLCHVSELSWQRVEDPTKVVEVGDTLEVQVLDVKEGGKRISLSVKALQEDPYMAFLAAHPIGSQTTGKVTRIQSYGAFIEVAPGVEGLAHVSQLAPGGAGSTREVVKLGQELAVRVASAEPERRRIGLSLLTERGDRLTDDVADDQTIREVLGRANANAPSPTLGDLLKKALEDSQG